MKLTPKDVSTIVILNKNRPGTRTLQIKTKHINRLTHYVVALGLLFIALTGTIIFLQYRNQQQDLERQLLITQIAQLKGNAPAVATQQQDKHLAQNYIQAIEGKLKNINEYLKKRGLKGFSTQNIGGDGNTEGSKLSDKEVLTAYNDYLAKLVNSVAFTPMGYPRFSSTTSIFGYRSDPFDGGHAEFHPGIDFKGKTGDEVRCTANGKVVFAGWSNGYGNCVRVQHTNNLETLYGHLSRIGVKVGQQVVVGEKLGAVGSTGRSTGAHLHYEVRKNGKPINPVNFLSLNN